MTCIATFVNADCRQPDGGVGLHLRRRHQEGMVARVDAETGYTVITGCQRPSRVNMCHYKFLFKDCSRKIDVGGGTELENGGTTNTILSFFMVQSI